MVLYYKKTYTIYNTQYTIYNKINAKTLNMRLNSDIIC